MGEDLLARVLGGVVLALIAVLVVAAWLVSQPAFDEPFKVPETAFTILPVDRALTFAVSEAGTVWLVVDAQPDAVKAIDINTAMATSYEDSLSAFRSLGYDALSQLASQPAEQIPMDQLSLPFRPRYPHIAAGTNFQAHAEEVGHEGEPFLFPKLSTASAWNAVVPKRTRLDYEVELCAVPLSAITPTDAGRFGFVLCNDFTDRWDLLREIDVDSDMGVTGFADAKGGLGMLPIGPFLVVPKDDTGFYAPLNLVLGLDDQLRQRAPAGLMIWSPQQIAEQALASCEVTFIARQNNYRIADCTGIPAGTLILTGTPEGVMFHLANIWSPWSYLSTGQEVVAAADHLGVLRNTIR